MGGCPRTAGCFWVSGRYNGVAHAWHEGTQCRREAPDEHGPATEPFDGVLGACDVLRFHVTASQAEQQRENRRQAQDAVEELVHE